MSLLLSVSRAEDAGLINDAERTVAEVATSVNDRIIEIAKYPVEPPGSGTSSREAASKPILNERCDPATENVGDCRPLLSVP